MKSAVENVCDASLVSPFVRAAREVFQTMLNVHCKTGETLPVDHDLHELAVTSIVTLSGKAAGVLGLSTTKRGALKILERMTGIEATEVDEMVRDVVGEMANMIGGCGKRELADYAFKLGLPQVTVDEVHEATPDRWPIYYWVALDTGIGPCTLHIGFAPET
ncbi:MAG: chemotaxis protein CheX [Planctomycetaceae bacterium]